MFFEKDYDLLPRTYSVKSYRRRESKVMKKLVGVITFLLTVSIIAFVCILFLIK